MGTQGLGKHQKWQKGGAKPATSAKEMVPSGFSRLQGRGKVLDIDPGERPFAELRNALVEPDRFLECLL